MEAGVELARLIGASRDPEALLSRFRYGSFVSHPHRLFYMETPKAACTTLKWVLANVSDFHGEPVWTAGRAQLEMCIHGRDFHPLPSLLNVAQPDEVLFGGKYVRFCVVRNPYNRLVSAWANKLWQGDPLFLEVNKTIQRYHGREGTKDICSFRDFADWVVTTNDPNACDVHWRPQEKLVFSEVVPYDAIIKTEKLVEGLEGIFSSIESVKRYDVRALLKRYNFNESLPITDELLYDDALAARVYKFYKVDFETFGYDRESWKKITPKTPDVAEVKEVALYQTRQRNLVIKEASVRLDRANAELAATRREADELRARQDAVEKLVIEQASDQLDRVNAELAATRREADDLRARLREAEARIGTFERVAERFPCNWARRFDAKLRKAAWPR